jgi:hypothetical protein
MTNAVLLSPEKTYSGARMVLPLRPENEVTSESVAVGWSKFLFALSGINPKGRERY